MNAINSRDRSTVLLMAATMLFVATTAAMAVLAFQEIRSARAAAEQQRSAILQQLRAIAESLQPPRPRWEYRIESPADFQFETEMATFGEEGWELVSARRATCGGLPCYEMIFKRARR